MDHRMHRVRWGSSQARMRTSVENWRQPLRWNAKRFMQCDECGWRGEAAAELIGCGVCGSLDLNDTRRRVAEREYEAHTGQEHLVVEGHTEFARAVIAEYERVNGITPAQGEQP